ncbi:DUF1572 family protein [Pseudalkalibacillus sp. Hm43]|uniref:DUF1572 family protein n=1 Tax=Pseudalkalibacillus sp. Hm43 TaxID=3450742 RepID=UPI003F41D743
MSELEKVYLEEIRENYRGLKKQAERVFDQLSTEELAWTPNEESNSIAILIKHMSGNMKSRWTDFLTTDGEKPDRYRDNEFIDDMETQEHMLEVWEEGWGVLFNTLNSLTEADLLKTVYIRSEPHTVIKALQRQVTHYAAHVGQIIYIGKLAKNKEWNTLSIPRGKSEEYK